MSWQTQLAIYLQTLLAAHVDLQSVPMNHSNLHTQKRGKAEETGKIQGMKSHRMWPTC